MIKKLAWNTFKNTGNIDTYLEIVKLEDLEKKLKVNEYGNNENKGDNNFRKQYGGF